MLYFKALFEGLDAMPPADAAIRAALDAEAAAHGWPALHAELARVDPITAARLPSGDAQRIQRAGSIPPHRAADLPQFHRERENAGHAAAARARTRQPRLAA